MLWESLILAVGRIRDLERVEATVAAYTYSIERALALPVLTEIDRYGNQMKEWFFIIFGWRQRSCREKTKPRKP